ncbi:iron-siderophore ABC transporter substrate-binding protein [Psittacicella gerlachiana]|uniref:Fe/B12 periplasmic-binding domain-containing protein n=1 Tax=Psittacicella gerlachiana TaxID=2028574 RepID=A0A3A1YMI3_9GAMM|nr:iron-siderophore ABC transporter substrate-binding protein [Psittacicella gerlachiana]RIY38761.1 hypothetical protein CKF59_00280 [Psittacicella gerlachiana]
MFKIIFTLCLCFLATLNSFANNEEKLRVATVDWTVAETLLALGVNPVGVGDVSSYNLWVKEPKINLEVTKDLGTRLQPNLELITRLDIALFINTPMYASLQTKLEKFAPVMTVDFTAENNIWQRISDSTLEVAKLTNNLAQGQALIVKANQELEGLKEKLQLEPKVPIAVVQFADSKNFRLYAGNSIVGAVLERLGLENVHPEAGNLWGFVNLTIDSLASFPENTQLVVVKPYPIDVPNKLAMNSLWNYLPLSKNVIVIPETWTFGGIPSALRFANLLVQGLEGDKGQW